MMYDNEVLHNLNMEEDTEIGIHPCTLTGNVSEDNPLFVEVILTGGLRQYARVLSPFPLISVPTAEWLSVYANLLIGYVAFQKGNPEKPLLIAVSPKDSKDSSFKDWPRQMSLLGETFKIVSKDIEKEAYVEVGGKFRIGSETSDQQIPRGNDLKNSLDALTDAVTSLCDAVLALTVPTPSGISLTPVNASQIAQVKSTLVNVRAEYSKFLSKITFVE